MPTTASDKWVLLDTSVWIDYFRKKQPLFDQVERLIEEGCVCTARLIVAELLQGASSESEFVILQQAVEVFHVLEEDVSTWVEAARLSNRIRRQGKAVGLGDCYIAQLAYQRGIELWSLDRHFRTIQKYLNISLYER